MKHRLAEKNIQVETIATGPLPRVMADPEQLKQVLINLIWNAVEAMSTGGVVQLSADAQSNRPLKKCDLGRLSYDGECFC